MSEPRWIETDTTPAERDEALAQKRSAAFARSASTESLIAEVESRGYRVDPARCGHETHRREGSERQGLWHIGGGLGGGTSWEPCPAPDDRESLLQRRDALLAERALWRDAADELVDRAQNDLADARLAFMAARSAITAVEDILDRAERVQHPPNAVKVYALDIRKALRLAAQAAQVPVEQMITTHVDATPRDDSGYGLLALEAFIQAVPAPTVSEEMVEPDALGSCPVFGEHIWAYRYPEGDKPGGFYECDGCMVPLVDPAQRPTVSEEMVERAALALFKLGQDAWENLPSMTRTYWRGEARIALTAALAAPTEEELTE